MSIVEEIYQRNIQITDLELTEEILKHRELTILDLWLLPQYPFNEWRRKYDYPRIIKNIKDRQKDFATWMAEQGLTEDYLLKGYLSDFFTRKPPKPQDEKQTFWNLFNGGISKEKIKKYLSHLPSNFRNEKTGSHDHKLYLIKVSHKGEVSNQVWHRWDGVTSAPGDGEPVLFEHLATFISYYDWKLLKGDEFDFVDTFERTNPNTENEQVYLNKNIKLLKMGGIRPPTNGVGILLRGKRLEFINASGLELRGTIYFGSMGNLSFDHCTVDNLVCNQLDMPMLYFQTCSVRNLQIRNSYIQQWMFLSCNTTGNIVDTRLRLIRIFGGQFNPTFANSEATQIEIRHIGFQHDLNFEKTYRSLARSAQEAGNKSLSQNLKIAELDFIRDKTKGVHWLLSTLDKLYWGYGQKPKRLIYIIMISVILFGLLYSFFPQEIKDPSLANKPYYKILYDSLYFSVVTFTTLGYGDFIPTEFLRLFAAGEALFGAITLGFLVAGLTRND